mmetsp:Transcript_9211/g.19121  ORF Transcript_9211/g.19121 Transcript_9211/m.19121 type:complete len:211 (+) Transcript_9211:2273-2905(+)
MMRFAARVPTQQDGFETQNVIFFLCVELLHGISMLQIFHRAHPHQIIIIGSSRSIRRVLGTGLVIVDNGITCRRGQRIDSLVGMFLHLIQLLIAIPVSGSFLFCHEMRGNFFVFLSSGDIKVKVYFLLATTGIVLAKCMKLFRDLDEPSSILVVCFLFVVCIVFIAIRNMIGVILFRCGSWRSILKVFALPIRNEEIFILWLQNISKQGP